MEKASLVGTIKFQLLFHLDPEPSEQTAPLRYPHILVALV